MSNRFEDVLERGFLVAKIRTHYPTIHWLEDHQAWLAAGSEIGRGWVQRAEPQFPQSWPVAGSWCPCFLLPRPNNVLNLLVGLHEVGHVALGHVNESRAKKGPGQERAATEWALNFAGTNAIPIPFRVRCLMEFMGRYETKEGCVQPPVLPDPDAPWLTPAFLVMVSGDGDPFSNMLAQQAVLKDAFGRSRPEGGE